MKESVTNDIIFVINIIQKEDFAKCSNFINKVDKHERLNEEETRDILYKRGENKDGNIGSHKWHRSIEEKYKEFLTGRNIDTPKQVDFSRIRQPEGISNIGEKFHVIYYLRMDERNLYEIVQFRELILLMEGYNTADIHSHIVGSNDFYFKLSQYLSWTIDEFSIRDAICFQDKNNFKKLQGQGIDQSTSFLPLIVVNEQNVMRLKDKCINQLGENTFQKIFSNSCKYADIQDQIMWKELGGIVKQFLNNNEPFVQLDNTQVMDVIKQMDVLALALMAYSMKNYKQNITISELNAYAKLQQQYANACHQLMENILFHSVAGWGILSVRIHGSRDQESNRYLEDWYGKEELTEDYFEVHICDFSAGKTNQNIAEHFLGQLDCEWKSKFDGMKPENLFKSALGVGDEFAENWKEYYRESENFGKHFGLRIFQGITKVNNGFFSAESYREHKIKNGENYFYHISSIEKSYVMPGTAYGILLPLKKGQDQLKKDITQEYGDWLSHNLETLLKLTVRPFDQTIEKQAYNSQESKNNIIRNKTEDIRTFFEKEGQDIVSFDASKFEENEAEIWAKAVLAAQFSSNCKPHVVFSQCSEMFMDGFTDTMRQMFSDTLENLFWGEYFQIALISEDGDQRVFVPGNVEMTDGLNQYISRMKGIKCNIVFEPENSSYNAEEVVQSFIPFDILIKTGDVTFFEKYVCDILEKNIQSEEFGCKISPTHMRLGSTIHIDHFYEAELLFGNTYFISRFAFLMIQDLYQSIQEEQIDKITLYGYASYSESLLVILQKALLGLKEGLDVDYILLERKEERREMEHEDNIRYGKEFSGRERVDYLKNRKFVVVVPINSTMKTHQRLISLLKEENAGITDDNILRNYALILVGPEPVESEPDQSDQVNLEKVIYWAKTKDHVLQCKYSIKPDPKYFIHVQTEYQESMTCKLCFPTNPIWERPLIEVNAASTIPNQAYGIVTGKTLDEKKLKDLKEIIKNEEEKINILKESLLYNHVMRNETHFLYYVKTEELTALAREQIIKSMTEWKNENIMIRNSEYHFIVAPMHYSNCQFLELVNELIFSGMASVIRIDFNKDFRNNAYTKYSNIRTYLKQLTEMGKEIEVKFHYVDDNIITGRTFFRAKSLIESIIALHKVEIPHVKMYVFDRVFTLIDRNSIETRMQYLSRAKKLEDVSKYFYCFLHIEVSSLRNYGDSCVICNLHKEANRLHSAAATGVLADYWEKESEKFRVDTVEHFIENENKRKELMTEDKIKEYKERAYRRLFSTHIIKKILDEIGFDNRKENASRIILTLLIEDYQYRSHDPREAFEYFISHLKVCSRPFLVFQTPIKEAIFDILLIIINSVVKGKEISEVLREGETEKEYWKELKGIWRKVYNKILKELDKNQCRELVLMIMKQLTELKSNYIMRLDNMNALFEFMKPFKNDVLTDSKDQRTAGEDFWIRYATYIKKLTGVSSDTSKSMWLDYALLHRKELVFEQPIHRSKEIDPLFSQIIRLENTRNFQDGIQKIYKKIKLDRQVGEKIEQYIGQYTESIYSDRRVNYIIKKYLLHWKGLELKEGSPPDPVNRREEILKYTSDKCALCPGMLREAFRKGNDEETAWEWACDYLNKHIEKIDEKTCDNLQTEYKNITEGYQFLDFCKLMCEMGWGKKTGEGYEYTEEGVKQITCCLVIKKLCEEADHTEEALLKRIDKIAKLAGAILGDNPVQIWAEYQDCSEYYKTVIEQMVEEKREELGIDKKIVENMFLLKTRKHYHTVGENTGHVIALDEKVQSLLNSEKILAQLQKYGYYYEDGDFLWQMGRKSRYPLYLYAEARQEESDKIAFLYKVRNLLSLSNDIEKSLFSAGKQNYLHEVDLANSRLSVLNREKSYSHTREENRIRNYNHLAGGKEQSRDDSLVLLSDLNVSRIYRDSLNMEFYQSRDPFGGMQLIQNMKVFFKNGIQERMHDEGVRKDEDSGNIEIHIHNKNIHDEDVCISDEEKLIFPEGRTQEILSLLLALILNVKERGRGSAENRIIDVYFSKTKKGQLRILNKTKCDQAELETIRSCMHREPANEESGITLWSLRACMKRAMVCFVREKLAQAMTEEDIEKLLKHLTEEAFEVSLKIIDIEGVHYFSYELPIFWETYNNRCD